MTGARLHLAACADTDDANRVIGVDYTRFKCAWKKHTRFGAQRHEIEAQRTNAVLNYETPSEFTFDVPFHDADLLLDTHLVLSLPHIWSTVRYSQSARQWKPHEFQWIRNIGCHIVHEIEVRVGGRVVQTIRGPYMQSVVDREFSDSKRRQYDEMLGNVADLYDPAAASGHYPHAWAGDRGDGVVVDDVHTYHVEPSIRGRRLCIPIMAWYQTSEYQALPLRSMRNEKLRIVVRFRPVKQWYTTLDESTPPARVSPDGEPEHNITRFIREPPVDGGGAHIVDFERFAAETDYYESTISTSRSAWNPNVYMVGTYAYLCEAESNAFLTDAQKYLFRDVVYQEYPDLVSSDTLEVNDKGVAHSITVMVQRDDVHKRNEWSNFTNWEFDKRPSGPTAVAGRALTLGLDTHSRAAGGDATGYRTSGAFALANDPRILKSVSLYCDGVLREDCRDAEVSNYIEHRKCAGYSPDFYYSFGLSTTQSAVHPAGALNLSNYRKFEIAVALNAPPVNPDSLVDLTCRDGVVIGVRQQQRMHHYCYRALVILEYYNVLSFENGHLTKVYFNRV